MDIQDKQKAWVQVPAGPVAITLIYMYLILLTFFVLYSLVHLWPSLSPVEGSIINPTPAPFLFWTFAIPGETHLLILVALGGTLGGIARTFLRLNSDIVHAYQNVKRQLPSYYTKPIIGLVLGVIFYIVIRGGFFSSEASVKQTSPFSFVGLAALVGLFADHAMEKLRQVAGSVFSKTKQEEDEEKEDK